MGQLIDSEGNHIGAQQLENIVHECYFISKKIHTSYTELMNISVIERQFLLKFILQEMEAEQKATEELQRKAKAKRK